MEFPLQCIGNSEDNCSSPTCQCIELNSIFDLLNVKFTVNSGRIVTYTVREITCISHYFLFTYALQYFLPYSSFLLKHYGWIFMWHIRWKTRWSAQRSSCSSSCSETQGTCRNNCYSKSPQCEHFTLYLHGNLLSSMMKVS